MDSCAVHETAAIKEALGNHDNKVLFIPRGFTSRLQVLDVGINRPFKHYMRQQFETFMLSNGQKIERLHIIWWVNGSWERITKETITNTWRSIGYWKNIMKKISRIFAPQRFLFWLKVLLYQVQLVLMVGHCWRGRTENVLWVCLLC